MKIFSSFDTEFKDRLYKEFKAKYGEKKVILVTRDKIFLWLKVVFPLIFLEISYIFLGFLFYLIDLEKLNNFKRFLYFFLFTIGNLFFGFKILKYFIDYKMDFAIITPKEILSYNQSGFFSRSSRSLDINKVKTISVDKKGFIRSIFNFGSVIFFSEGDDTGHGDIELKFISSPEILRRKIEDIVGYGKFDCDKKDNYER